MKEMVCISIDTYFIGFNAVLMGVKIICFMLSATLL